MMAHPWVDIAAGAMVTLATLFTGILCILAVLAYRRVRDLILRLVPAPRCAKHGEERCILCLPEEY